MSCVQLISDPNEEKLNDVLEDPIATPHEDIDDKDSIEYYVFHLDLKDASCKDEVHLHENTPAAIIVSKENKG